MTKTIVNSMIAGSLLAAGTLAAMVTRIHA
jgi:hypothetical protein